MNKNQLLKKMSVILFVFGLFSLSAFSERGGANAQQVDWNANRHADMRYDNDRKGWARKGWGTNHSPNLHQFNIVCSPYPVRYGSCSERFELRNTDCDSTDCPFQRTRSEIGIDHSKVKARLNKDIWYGWSFYNENIGNYGGTYNPNIFLGQWKTDNDAGPVITLVTVRTDHSTAIRGNKTVAILLEDLGGRQSREWQKANDFAQVCYLWDMASEKGKWVDIVINTNFGTDANGYLNVWINGKPRCAYKGIITVTPLGKIGNGSRFKGPQHRHGIYAAALKYWYKNHPNKPVPTWVAYYDEFREGKSRDEVDIRLIEARNGRAVD